MKKQTISTVLCPLYIVAFAAMFCAAFAYSKVADSAVENAPFADRHYIVIDAGHGGIDGGTTSYTGVPESTINLQIALCLNDLLHLLGVETVMIRDGDYSVYTQGQTIAQQKVSDLKQRVHIVNTTTNAFLISIHQNHFQDSRYFGPQVFYPAAGNSKAVAQKMQAALNATLSPGSNREHKAASGIYLMEKITCDGMLIECGFLSNPAEEHKLLDPEYQKKLCCVIASVSTNYLFDQQIA